jgi:acetyl-CoA carboxylase carboxyl transferase subunit beta
MLRRSESGDEFELAPAREVCLSCEADLEGSRSYEQWRVCHSCGFHFHLTARERVASLLDPGSFHEVDRGVTNIDPLSFSGRQQSYRRRVINAQRRTGLSEAALTGTGSIGGRDVVVAVLDFSFLGGSIGVAAGERLARAFEKAAARRVPLVVVCSTSGTRMQEGVLALLQVARVSAAAAKFAQLGLPHIAVLTDPTTGSAYSGFVNLADFAFAEPNALIGYAALRVLQEQAGDELPATAHTSESHAAHGLIDAVVDRPHLRESIAVLLDLLVSDYQLSGPRGGRHGHLTHTHREAMAQLELSRHKERPAAGELITRMSSAFVPLRGDRTGSDDPAIVAGFASLGGEAVVVIGQDRRGEGGDGWIRPAGFRKAARAMRLAARFNLPVVTLIDTVGAHPGVESEQTGLGPAVAGCLVTLLDLPVPTVAVITGEGNSEAALAMAACDRVLMLDNAVYEVIRPEDAARILYQEAGKAPEVAERLRITSHDCLRLGVADATIPEPGEGAHTDPEEMAHLVRRAVLRELTRLQAMRPKKRLSRRFERYRQAGDTRAWVRGTAERRLAHLFDRLGGIWDRLRGRPRDWRRRSEYGDSGGIPI